MANIKTHAKPAPNTKVKVTKGSYLVQGKVVYVASYQNDDPKVQLVINERPDREHGYYIQEWELVDDSPINSLSKRDRQALTDAALKAAKVRGYCNETRNILADLGLPTEPTPQVKKVTVEIEYTVKDGFVFQPSNLLYNDNNTKAGSPVIEIKQAKTVG